MSNSEVFGSPMILTGRKPVSPFGAPAYRTYRDSLPTRLCRQFTEALRRAFMPAARQRRIRKTVVELSKLDDHVLKDIGLNRASLISAAHAAEARRRGDRGPLAF